MMGIDCFTDYYPKKTKMSNLARLRREDRFRLRETDLADANLNQLPKADYVFHLAAQPGVRGSWGDSFPVYAKDNIVATQRLLEASLRIRPKMLIFVSSSSVYGAAEQLPTSEDVSPRPISPYGVTKMTAENLCRVYSKRFGLSVVILRYFTVYGPRQRPDMAFHRFINGISRGVPIAIYGTGAQERDFTFVDDIVQATVLAMGARGGETYNVGSGKPIKLTYAIKLMEELIGRRAITRYKPEAAGDVEKTSANIRRIQAELGYSPRSSLEDGIARQVEWQLGKASRSSRR